MKIDKDLAIKIYDLSFNGIHINVKNESRGFQKAYDDHKKLIAKNDDFWPKDILREWDISDNLVNEIKKKHKKLLIQSICKEEDDDKD